MNNTSKSFYVGSRILTIDDPKNGLSFAAVLHYPALEKSTTVRFGPYLMDVSVDAIIAPGVFPVVIVSHGNSGSPFVYRTISTHLAARGYIVAMIEHYGNNRNDNTLADSLKNLEYRPLHLSFTIDGLINDSEIKPHCDTDKIAVIGHSFGGYTALAAAGGSPYARTGELISTKKDSRIKALILMAPAAGYFSPEKALQEVNIPILLYTASEDIYTPKQWTSAVILKGVPNTENVIVKEIKNAGHFSFLSPFPEAMANPNFLPATDPEGFDRAAFHQELPVAILHFLNEKLGIE
ncbi:MULTISPECIES: alpha/beta hydrolase family protein [unclassified Flavobacterium]|uniref:alpha/beta hydrolase family protein n=1 Tax=unclassified Flavobacterium TaxID=196869 RepID=UPI003F92197A